MLAGPRLQAILTATINPGLNATPPPQSPIRNVQDPLGDFHQFSAPTLPHLLALLLHPTSSFPPPKTGLIVVDAISTLFGSAFLRLSEGSQGNKDGKTLPKSKNDPLHWATSRKWAVVGDFISKVGRLAVVKDVTILLISQTKTKVRMGAGAVLLPSVSSSIWDVSVANQIVLFRDDHLPREQPDAGEGNILDSRKIRFAGVLRSGGVAHTEGALGKVVPFVIEEVVPPPISFALTLTKAYQQKGARDIEMPMHFTDASPPQVIPTTLKRKRDEIPNSQSEDDGYGWDTDDEAPTEDDTVDAFEERG
ncbi:MAG: hypothetical protein M1840_002914 [Geoglossum simile]|nr:MAG: hypothetical protein M1840_002914 [Geoglossum simile]